MAEDVATISSSPALGFAAVVMMYLMIPRPSVERSRRLGNRLRRRVRQPLRPEPRVLEKQLSPGRLFRPALEDPAIEEGPAVEVVVDLARQDEPVDERRVE